MHLTQRIGNTVYRVKLVVNESGTQTLEDTLLQLVRNNSLANEIKHDIMSIPQEGHPQLERMPS